jgi:hypothetical protein
MSTLEIMFDDLTEDAKERVLEFYGYESPADGNFDIAALFVLEDGQ